MATPDKRPSRRSIRRATLPRGLLFVLLIPLVFGLDVVARWRPLTIVALQSAGGSQIWWGEGWYHYPSDTLPAFSMLHKSDSDLVASGDWLSAKTNLQANGLIDGPLEHRFIEAPSAEDADGRRDSRSGDSLRDSTP
jgi:hypothetical protein